LKFQVGLFLARLENGTGTINDQILIANIIAQRKFDIKLSITQEYYYKAFKYQTRNELWVYENDHDNTESIYDLVHFLNVNAKRSAFWRGVLDKYNEIKTQQDNRLKPSDVIMKVKYVVKYTIYIIIAIFLYLLVKFLYWGATVITWEHVINALVIVTIIVVGGGAIILIMMSLDYIWSKIFKPSYNKIDFKPIKTPVSDAFNAIGDGIRVFFTACRDFYRNNCPEMHWKD